MFEHARLVLSKFGHVLSHCFSSAQKLPLCPVSPVTVLFAVDRGGVDTDQRELMPRALR